MAQFRDAVGHRLVGDHDVAPDLLVERVPRNHLARVPGKADQHVHDPGFEVCLGVAPHYAVLAGLDERLTDVEARLQFLTRKGHGAECYISSSAMPSLLQNAAILR